MQKEAIIVNIDGFFKEPVIVPSETTGVMPIYEYPEATEENPEPEQVLVGYQIAIPVQQGLYKPKFDFAAWDIYSAPFEFQKDENGELVLDENGQPIPVAKPEVQLWVEGLSQDEINPPKTLDEIKQEKLQELREARDMQMVSGFSSVIGETTLYFGFDAKDNEYLNEMALSMAIDPTITETAWKTKDGFFTLTREQFFQVIRDARLHKEGLIREFMHLEGMVLNASSKSEVDAIVW